MKQTNGSCACGSVEYQLNSKIKNVVNCHCDMCKSHNGSSFSTYTVLPFKSMEITKGKNFINEYSAGTGKKRFCKKCGTPLYNTSEKYPGACMVFLGTLSSPADYVPKVNVWCESQLSWVGSVSGITSLPRGVERKSA